VGGKVGRRWRREKGVKGESDCEDVRGRGCREGYWDWLTPLVPGMNWLLSFSRICLVTMGSLNSTKQYRAIVLQRGVYKRLPYSYANVFHMLILTVGSALEALVNCAGIILSIGIQM